MLQQLLQEIESAQGAINLNEMARKLGIERGALAGMIEFWIRKGRLKVDSEALESVCGGCSGIECGGNPAGSPGGPFIINMPRTFSLVRGEKD